MANIDLHMHSTASDGSDTPAELVEKAKNCKLAAIALTDHDTLAGIPEALQAASKYDLEVIPGCEISTASELCSHHILGLWADAGNKDLGEFLSGAKKRREKRNLAMLSKLDDLGLKIELADMANTDLDQLGRPHIAAAMVKKGFVPDMRAAFRDYIGKDGKAYVPKNSPSPEAAIEVLASTGATVIWAHPLLQNIPPNLLEELIKRFAAAGLHGLEVWHSAQTRQQSQLLLNLAQKYHLAVSGGSDYHGLAKPDIQPGVGTGNLAIPLSVLENLKQQRLSRGLPC